MTQMNIFRKNFHQNTYFSFSVADRGLGPPPPRLGTSPQLLGFLDAFPIYLLFLFSKLEGVPGGTPVPGNCDEQPFVK